ncbi:hypothetical protein EPA93_05270 [Ktedonosporobacter rubrisoli]|uniref:Uncharacterized protein n=1 Tax=Ktedonosporobacter rubrisoli TaxID=2509675 RepID=A0A4P6JJY2_KTERU|nr:hypothetical protein [Ktedonosporobacter rubrisoli]QBD75444.1 hypothetical protein EPA93_05270 [Ktedonosporobacter rubrisoli]
MHPALTLSLDSRVTAGLLLLTIVGIEYGGWFILRIVRGAVPMTEFQKTFARAGHAHAGVLVILSLVGQLFADATSISGPLALLARNGIWIAALLIPAGFFFSSIGKNVTRPNRLILLLYLGMASLTLGVVSLGVGLLSA